MARLLQSTLHPGTASDWLADLQAEAQVVQLSPAHPTFLLKLIGEQDDWLARHELVFGLFRTVWTCSVNLDREASRLVARGASQHFESFEQTLCWSSTEHGLSIQSDCIWSGCKPGLEDILLRSLLRFPGWQAPGASERPTQRLVMEARAVA